MSDVLIIDPMSGKIPNDDGVGPITISPSRKYAWRHRKKHPVRGVDPETNKPRKIDDLPKKFWSGKDAGPAPYNPEYHLERSIRISKKTSRRMAYDPVHHELLIFDLDEIWSKGDNVSIPKYHGHARKLDPSSFEGGSTKFCKHFASYFLNCGSRFRPKSKDHLIEEGIITEDE